MSRRRIRKREIKEEDKEREELKQEDKNANDIKEECFFLPDCQICSEKIKINDYFSCPGCHIEWCKKCIADWLKTHNYCTGCKKIIWLKSLKSNYGINKAYEVWKQSKINLNNQNASNVNDLEVSEQEKCKAHGQKTATYCNKCDELVCPLCITSGTHDQHSIVGNVLTTIGSLKEQAKSMIEAINHLSLSENIIFIRNFMRIAESAEKDYESRFILYNIYLKKAIETQRYFAEVINQLELYTTLDNGGFIENLSNIPETIEKSKKMIRDSDQLMNLSSFVKNQRILCEPFALSEQEFFVSLNSLNNCDPETIIMLNGDDYMITFSKINLLYLHQIEFTWLNSPNKWSHDLKLNLYFKSKSNGYILLTDEPKVVSPSNSSEVLCLRCINDLLEINNQIIHEHNMIDASNEDRQAIDQYLTFKLEIELIDYGMSRAIESDPFKVYQGYINSQISE